MLEDKLSREERIRLEALHQSNVATMHLVPSDDDIITRAKKFEAYIKGEE